MQTYAARYPDEVAGVALVDSSQPDQFSHQPVARGSYEPQKFDVFSLAARLGTVRLLSKLAPAPLELPQRQRAQIDAQSPSTRQVSTYALELRATPQTTTQTRSLRSLGDKPLAVVSAPKQAEPGWLKLQDDLVTLSSNSTHRVVEGATHTSLLYERSDAQASSAAIVEVVAAVRNDRLLGR
jgi:pimeloyl-ACP methyl ester carboxylesterase